MRLLMITRKIDADDWLAGHNYEWAKKIESKLLASGGRLVVICLETGNLGDLSGEVYSLGKARGAGRLARFWKFGRLANKLVKESDGIFCHQNPEFAIAVWPWAALYGKKIVSWYTHKSVTGKSWLMLALSKKVLTASKESFRLLSPKVEVVGHGIDINRFQIAPIRQARGRNFRLQNIKTRNDQPFRIITIGRISPVKNLEILIEAARVLAFERQRRDFVVKIYGNAGLPSQQAYSRALKALVLKTQLDEFVHFKAGVPHSAVVPVYQTASVFVNLSATGSLDKAVLEAMSCGVPVITSNEAFFELLSPFAQLCLAQPGDAQDLAKKLAGLAQLDPSDSLALGANLRRLVAEKHNLDKLCAKIIRAFR